MLHSRASGKLSKPQLKMGPSTALALGLVNRQTLKNDTAKERGGVSSDLVSQSEKRTVWESSCGLLAEQVCTSQIAGNITKDSMTHKRQTAAEGFKVLNTL